ENNVNGVGDGYTGTFGKEAVASTTMTAPNRITAFQDAYVRKTIDCLNDLPNVLWIVSEEAPPHSFWWNDHIISLIKEYEKQKPLQHPVGYGEVSVPNPEADDVLYNSNADWVAPLARVSPTRSCGKGEPPCKVNINDSDHSYFGMWNDTPQQNRTYIWENFMNGNQVLFMDPYVVWYPRQQRNLCANPAKGICPAPHARYDNFRDNLGYVLRYSRKLDLARILPHPELSSTGYCLAATTPPGVQYLVYAPSGGAFTVNLSGNADSRELSGEWFNPATGRTVSQRPIASGSTSVTFKPPFEGDAILYLSDKMGKEK
ncbi:MAG TPA: putative collagen-binding domain-containing protein, partial [Chryseosolibacter sp.]